ncbi:28S ribosomal protein S22, mitochondrial-like [Dendronephthya gigantea]|uniref:28S ribosomal protein S22, mitochondrial-like n=1 Tax=Dendronephthya gigantea TaxID=151771 RepID=UPI0010699FF0|nr:28S ribosomal protein S22, mitochondrial-like [Dendronephthya gigantea]
MATILCRNVFRINIKPVSVRVLPQLSRLLSESTGKVAAFDDPRVQLLLKRITGRNLDKVLASRHERGVGLPSYKLLTNEELSLAEKEIEKEAEKYLEMPAIMEERKDSNIVLESRPDLEGYSECNIVFTDISQGTNNRDRRIVVRESNGGLREARWEERDRMNFLFFQREGQSYKMPRVLEDENMQNAFNRDGHVGILDLVCVQCEADSAEYIKVHQRTYEDINRTRSFDLLRSTRHFGGLVYYLTKQKILTWLLVDILKRDLISDACDVIQLFHILHPDSKSAAIARQEGLGGLDLIKVYLEAEGPRGLLQFLEDDKKTIKST